MNTLSCIGCFRQFSSSRYLLPFIEHGEIPKCPNCSKILKPDIVLFGEQLPYKPWLLAKSEVDKSDLLIVAGSSLTVTPVAELPILAFENNAMLIIINLTPTYIDENSDVVLHGDVANIVPAIAVEVIHNN
jgi:NAD-dependent deacetylase